MAASFVHVLGTFHRQLQGFQPYGWIVPPLHDLRIHLGLPALNSIRHVAAALSPETMLLYLFPGELSDEMALLRAFSDLERQRIIPVSVGSDTFAVDRVSMAATLLRYGNLEFSASASVREGREELIGAINAAMGEATYNKMVSRDSWMSVAAAVTGNVGVWRRRESLRLVTGKKTFPAVVCGAGPSLVKTIPSLLKVRDQIFVIAVGHAFKTLVTHGLRPDLVVEIDVNCRLNWLHDLELGDIPLAASIVADPEVVARFKQVLWCATSALDRAWNTWFAGLGCQPLGMATGRSVVITAVDLAAKAGFDRIALVGNDLCYSNEGHSHAGGECSGSLDSRLVPVPGSDGGTVLSDGNFIGIRNGLEDYLRRLSPGSRICNCTPGGTLISGAAYMGIEDFLAFGEMNPAPVLTVMERQNGDAWLSQTMQVLDDLHNLAGMIERTAPALAGRDSEQAQQTIAGLMQAESGMMEEEAAGVWVRNLRAQVDDWMDTAVDIDRSGNDIAAMIANLECRYRTQRLLTLSLSDKLRAAMTCCFPDGLRLLVRDIYRLSGFTVLFARWAERSHPALSKWLLEAGNDWPKEWRLGMKWQHPPVVWRRTAQGWRLLEPTISQSLEAGIKIKEELERIGFRDGVDGVVFLAPTGWKHVVPLGRQCRESRLLVVEPWPELLHLVTGCTFFYHLLPRQCGVIGAGARFPDWPEVFVSTMKEWKEAGIVPRLLVHPMAAGEPDVRALERQLRKLMEHGIIFERA